MLKTRKVTDDPSYAEPSLLLKRVSLSELFLGNPSIIL